MSGPEQPAGQAGRSLEVDGTFNVRDVGGYVTAGGATVDHGRIFRSATLDGVTKQGIDQLRDLGLRTVLDLRSSEEIERHGRFPVDRMGVRWEHLPSTVRPPSGSDPASSRLLEHPDPMAPMYVQVLKTSGPEFARGLRILADPANHPAIVHCTSGKDRTGLFVLTLHLVLGVGLDDALAHYEQSDAITEDAANAMLTRYPEMAALPTGKMMRMAGTNRRWVIGALAAVGGEQAVPQWLASHGCDQHTQALLRASLVQV